MWIDSHCHLNHEKIREAGSVDDLVAKAHQAGIGGMVTICCRIADEFPDILKIAQNHENVWCSIGTHPHNAGEEEEQAISQTELIRQAKSDPNIIGIGESGLDYYYDNAPREDQKRSFRKHIRACIETGLPLIVHAREADDDVAAIIREEGANAALKGVMHCFSSGPALAEDMLDFGFYISFSGILTFKNAGQLREIAQKVPPERLLVETDAPYLAPEPHRGKVNAPVYVRETGKILAQLHGKTEEDMAKITTENFFRLFDKAKPV